MQIGAAMVENTMEFPQKIKNETTFDPGIPLLGIYLQNPETWNINLKEYITLMCTSALFTVAKTWK